MTKKTLLGILLVMFIAISSVWAIEPQVLGSDTIEFKGFIEGNLYFAVTKLNESSVNLLAEELQPGNSGVDIGKWTLRIDNPPVEETSFTISYSFEPLRSTLETIEDEIEFVLLERPEEGEVTPVERTGSSSVTLTISVDAELTTFTRVFAARLTPAGFTAAMTAAATDTYKSDIFISLSAE